MSWIGIQIENSSFRFQILEYTGFWWTASLFRRTEMMKTHTWTTYNESWLRLKIETHDKYPTKFVADSFTAIETLQDSLSTTMTKRREDCADAPPAVNLHRQEQFLQTAGKLACVLASKHRLWNDSITLGFWLQQARFGIFNIHSYHVVKKSSKTNVCKKSIPPTTTTLKELLFVGWFLCSVCFHCSRCSAATPMSLS